MIHMTTVHFNTGIFASQSKCFDLPHLISITFPDIIWDIHADKNKNLGGEMRTTSFLRVCGCQLFSSTRILLQLVCKASIFAGECRI